MGKINRDVENVCLKVKLRFHKNITIKTIKSNLLIRVELESNMFYCEGAYKNNRNKNFKSMFYINLYFNMFLLVDTEGPL